MDKKICNRCNEVKMLSEFYSKKKVSKSKGEYIYYNPECKECTKQAATIWQNNNVDKKRQTKREWARRNKEITRMHSNKSRKKGYQKEWRRNNPDKLKGYNTYREMHKHHNITDSEWELCKEYFNYQCAYCGIEEDIAKEQQGNYLHKEHVDHDGSNDLNNCIPSCKSCNSRKHNFEFEEWYINFEHYTDSRMRKIKKWIDEDYKKYIEEESDELIIS